MWRKVWQEFTQSNAPDKHVELIIIGCGTIKLGTSLGKEFGSIAAEGEAPTEYQKLFKLYVDQQREAYKALGMKEASHVTCARCCAGLFSALKQGITRCWCFCSSGDVKQQGGAFVLNPEGDCLFKHQEKNPTDHADIQQLFEAAGIQKKNFQQ
jgi:hypothetical protein